MAYLERKKEEELKEIKRKLIVLQIIDAPGYILLGLGLYAKFSAKGNAFHPLLNDPRIVNGMLFLGGLIAIVGIVKLIPLLIRQSELQRESAM